MQAEDAFFPVDRQDQQQGPTLVPDELKGAPDVEAKQALAAEQPVAVEPLAAKHDEQAEHDFFPAGPAWVVNMRRNGIAVQEKFWWLALHLEERDVVEWSAVDKKSRLWARWLVGGEQPPFSCCIMMLKPRSLPGRAALE